jgi:hypothetical protein
VPLIEPPDPVSVALLPVEPEVDPEVDPEVEPEVEPEPIVPEPEPVEPEPVEPELPAPGAVEVSVPLFPVEEPVESVLLDGVLVVGTLLVSSFFAPPLSSFPLEHPVIIAKISITLKAQVKVLFMSPVSFIFGILCSRNVFGTHVQCTI